MIFEKTKTPLTKWFLAAYLMSKDELLTANRER